MLKNTIFIFTSDNGGETNITSNDPLRGGKSQLYEGGIRVPLIVQWPAKIKAGSLSHQPTVNTDFYPTIFHAIDGRNTDGKDGISILSNLINAKHIIKRTIFWHYPLSKPHFLGGFSGGAIREGDWKLIEKFGTGEIELYNLEKDLSEENNVSGGNVEIVNILKNKLKNWRESILKDK